MYRARRERIDSAGLILCCRASKLSYSMPKIWFCLVILHMECCTPHYKQNLWMSELWSKDWTQQAIRKEKKQSVKYLWKNRHECTTIDYIRHFHLPFLAIRCTHHKDEAGWYPADWNNWESATRNGIQWKDYNEPNTRPTASEWTTTARFCFRVWWCGLLYK